MRSVEIGPAGGHEVEPATQVEIAPHLLRRVLGVVRLDALEPRVHESRNHSVAVGETGMGEHGHTACSTNDVDRLDGREPVPRDVGRAVRAQILDRKSTRLNSSHIQKSRMPSSA